MDHEKSMARKAIRGRPRRNGQAPVADRLLNMTEALLKQTNHIELTERRIAATAGVDDRMIHYYFGDKDGLIFAVIARYCDSVSTRLAALECVDAGSPTITRDIYRILVEAFFAKPWIAQILASELAHRNSPIALFFTQKYGVQGEAPVRLRYLFERLIECGVYDAELDVAQAVLALFLMSVAPVMVGPLFANVGAEADWYKRNDWLDFIADVFDRKFRYNAAREVRDPCRD